jgi:hypothetical protein
MGQIIVTALIAGAVTGLANGIFSPTGTLFTAVTGVITKIVGALNGVGV